MLRHALIWGAMVLAGCERGSPPPAPPSGAPTPEQPAAPTPVWDAYVALNAEMQPVSLELIHVDSHKARLEVDPNAPEGELERARGVLEQAQPLITRLLDLAQQRIEPITDLTAAQRQERLRGFGLEHFFRRILFADASRCAERLDTEGMVSRLEAALRIHGLDGLSGEPTFVGSSLASKLTALHESGMFAAITFEQRQRLLSAIDALKPVPLDVFVAEWTREARERVATCRATFAVPGGPAALAAHIDINTIDPDKAPMLNAITPGLEILFTEAGILLRQDLDTVRNLSPKEVARRIDAAEALVPRTAAALEQPDRYAALKPLVAEIIADKSQVVKIVIEAPWMHRDAHERSARDLDQVRVLLQPLE